MTTAAHHADHPSGTAGWFGWVLVVAVLALLLVAVVLGVVRVARSGRRVPTGRVVALVAGFLVIAAALAPPLADRAHHDLRAHMVQHMLLGTYGPLLLALGGPVRLLLGAGGRRLRGVVGAVVGSRWLRVVGHPVTAGVLVAGGLYALYLTDLYTLSGRSTAVHVAVHVHLLAAGYLLAWSLVGVDPAPHRPGLAVRVAVLVATGGTHAHLAKHLYANAGDLPPGAGQPAAVVREAAQWMYYTGDVAEVAIAVALFTAWYRSRRRTSRVTGGPARLGWSVAG